MSDTKQTKTLMLRLEAAISRLEDIADSQSLGRSVTAGSQGDSTQETSPPSAGAATIEEPKAVPPAVLQYDELVETHLKSFKSCSEGLGEPIAELANVVQSAFAAEREMILAASHTKSPAMDSSDFVDFLKPLQTQLMAANEFKDKNRASKLFNHISTVVEGIPALGWVAVSPAPAPFVGDMKDSAQFYANRVIKDFKDKDAKHVEWARSYITLLAELQKYVKSAHTTGLVWNAKGDDLEAYLAAAATTSQSKAVNGGTAAPPPPPPGPPPPPFAGDTTASAPKSDMNSVFADLNRGSSVTAGLKKVDKSQMTHKNPALRDAPAAESKRPVPSAKPAKLTKQPSYVKKPPRKELEGTKWFIENFEDDPEIVIKNIELNQSVYVYNCRNSTIQIKGKFNALSFDSCTKIGLVVDTLVSSIDLIKTKSFAIQVMDKCPTIICDVCESGQIYLAAAASDCEVITSKCGSININIDHGDGEFKEEAVPEMLKHKIVNGKLETTIVVHAD